MEMNEMKPGHLFDPRFLAFYQPLHEKYTPWQRKIAYNRIMRTKHLQEYQRNVGYIDEPNGWLLSKLPVPAPKMPEIPNKFKIELPQWCLDQRNQMITPADDAALIVKTLNLGKPGVIIDMEDSQVNHWDNTSKAYSNLFRFYKGELSYSENAKEYKVNPKAWETKGSKTPTVLWVKPRGLHMTQVLRFPMALQRVETSASLLDIALTAYNFSSSRLPCPEQPLAFYIPKSEYAEEALWWESLFKDIAKMKGWPLDTIKCMALIESHSLAYQMQEFIFNLKDHIVGLSLGSWNYLANLIEQNLWDSKWVLPDLDLIHADVALLQNVRKQLVDTCHQYGILAISDMMSKTNDTVMGVDGIWTICLNQIDVNQLSNPNHLNFSYSKSFKNYNLRPLVDIEGEVTKGGTRHCIRTAIRYRNGVLNGMGVSLLDGRIEDLATDRICRMMIAQRMLHIDGHTRAFITKLFDEEFEKLVAGGEIGTPETLRRARILTEKYVFNGFHNPN